MNSYLRLYLNNGKLQNLLVHFTIVITKPIVLRVLISILSSHCVFR